MAHDNGVQATGCIDYDPPSGSISINQVQTPCCIIVVAGVIQLSSTSHPVRVLVARVAYTGDLY